MVGLIVAGYRTRQVDADAWVRAVDAWNVGTKPMALRDLIALSGCLAGREYADRTAVLTGEPYTTSRITMSYRDVFDRRRLLELVGEPRHRRSDVYACDTGTRTRQGLSLCPSAKEPLAERLSACPSDGGSVQQ